MNLDNIKRLDFIFCLFVSIVTGLIFFSHNYIENKNISNDKIIFDNYNYSAFPSTGVSPEHDQLTYGVYTRRVMDGNWYTGDPLIYERRDINDPIPKLPYFFSGIISRLLGSVNSFFRLADFLFPFLSIIIGYFFLRLFLKNNLIALWGSIILLSNYSITQLIKIFFFMYESLFANSANYTWHFNHYALKYPSYQLVLPFTFLFYYCSYQLLKKNNKFYCIATGILAGLSFYIYVYSFITIGLQIAFLMIWAFVSGKRALSIKFLFSGIIGLLIGSIYLYDFFSFLSDPNHIFKSMAANLTKSIDYSIIKTGIKMLALFPFIIYLSSRLHQFKNNTVFILSIGIPSIFIILASMVIYFVPQTSHINSFEARNSIYLSLLLIITVFFNKRNVRELIPSKLFNYLTIKQKNVFIKKLFIALIVVHSCQIMASEIFYLYKKSSMYYHHYTVDRDSMEAYNWLEKNAPNESVVLSLGQQHICLLPILSGTYVYIPDMFSSNSSPNEIWERIKQGFAFYGVEKKKLENILKGNNQALNQELINRKPINESELKKMKQAYLEYNKHRFADMVFHGLFLHDSRSLSYQYFKKYFNEEEHKQIRDNEDGKLFYQGIWFIPSNLIKEKLSDYQSKAGDIDLLKYKVDYIWFGPMEKNLTGLKSLQFDELKIVFKNKDVTLYKIEG